MILLRFAEFLQLGFPKSDHVSNGITIAHVIAFGKIELQELQTAVLQKICSSGNYIIMMGVVYLHLFNSSKVQVLLPG